MGFRFQKRIKIMPGVTLNLSKKGVSTSVGVRGAKITLGHGQTRKTVSLPGSGLSYTEVTKNKRSLASSSNATRVPVTNTISWLALFCCALIVILLLISLL